MSERRGPPVEKRLNLPHQLDAETRDALKSLGEADTDPHSSTSGREKQVTPDSCAIMREMHDRGMEPVDISRTLGWLHTNQVYYHVNDRCNCKERTHVHYDECVKMRNRARRGAPTDTLAMLFDIGRDAVRLHIYGRCTHEDGVEPLESHDFGPDAATVGDD